MRRLRFVAAPALAGAVVAAALAGLACSRAPSAPEFSSSSGAPAGAVALAPPVAGLQAADRFDPGRNFVDLSLGRLTVVEGQARVRTILTGQEPGPWGTFEETIERQVVDLRTPVGGGPTYRRERVRHLEGGGTPFETFDHWRQDRSGLYLYSPEGTEATVARRALAAVQARAPQGVAAAFARATEAVLAKRAAILAGGPPGGPVGDEITFLRYPLRRGATWEGRVGFNLWTVEETEWIDTPAGRLHATRLSIEIPEFFGPRDRALTWWDAPGEVRRDFHLFSEAVDDQGAVIGEVEFEEGFALTVYEPDAPF
jgi:hypothetical protein